MNPPLPTVADRILEVYQRFDTLLGKVMERMEPDTTLIVLSDHGFRSYRTAVNSEHLAGGARIFEVAKDQRGADEADRPL